MSPDLKILFRQHPAPAGGLQQLRKRLQPRPRISKSARYGWSVAVAATMIFMLLSFALWQRSQTDEARFLHSVAAQSPAAMRYLGAVSKSENASAESLDATVALLEVHNTDDNMRVYWVASRNE